MRRFAIILGCAFTASCGDAAVSPSADLRETLGESGEPVTADENFDCIGTATGTFDNVFVPPGETCTLDGARVKGSVLAREHSRLYVVDTEVEGNIVGVEADIVQVEGGSLGGSIQIAEGSSPGETGAAVFGGTVLTQGNIQIVDMSTGTIRIADVVLVKGNIKVEGNSTSAGLEIVRNDVAQNLQVNKNYGDGAKSVTDNRVMQIVQCKENAAPFAGGPNDTAEAEGQCS